MQTREYRKKRDFTKTPEPKGSKNDSFSKNKRKPDGKTYVIQEHFASHHHFDLRLELDGVLKSWALPKGPTMDPSEKRLAVHVEDHPMEYGSFEGVIPKGEYGAGKVILWDRGVWEIEGDPHQAYKSGKLDFKIKGQKLNGRFALIRTKIGQGKKGKNTKENWLFLKKKDEYALAGHDVAKENPGSVLEHLSPLKNKDLAKFLTPQLAALHSHPPKQKNWIQEIKYDGYRTIAVLENGKSSLYTRSSLDWSDKYPLIAQALMSDAANDAIIDGEVVWLDEDGRSNFEGLQRALKNGDASDIFYYVFDILRLNGKDLRSLPQEKRVKITRDFVRAIHDERVRYSEHLEGEPQKIFDRACELGLEGIIFKRSDASYVSGKSGNWIKVKCAKEERFTIVGYFPRENAPQEIGSLILARKTPEGLEYAGKVGTGFDRGQRRQVFKMLSRIERKTPALKTENHGEGERWVSPKLQAWIKFSEITKAGKLRQAVYQGLEEKNPEYHLTPKEKRLEQNELSSLITSPNKLLFPKVKVTKMRLASYYNNIYPFMREHIRGKILTLLKCPEGVQGDCFYNKHIGHMKGLVPVEVQEKGKRQSYFTIERLEGLISLARYNALEIHTWNARAIRPTLPDEMIFDLDPGKNISNNRIIEAALELQDLLAKIGLESFAKFTGKKGLHIHVPLRPSFSGEKIYQLAKSIAYLMEEQNPQSYTANARLERRAEKIFIDYLRNSFGATYICPFSTRKTEEATIAAPLSWKQVKDFDFGAAPTIESMERALAGNYRHPWKDYWDLNQTIKILHG